MEGGEKKRGKKEKEKEEEEEEGKEKKKTFSLAQQGPNWNILEN